MELRTINAPAPQTCAECGARTHFVLNVAGSELQEVEMHYCTCSKSEYRNKREACEASGGHDEVEVSAGSRSYFECRKCGT